MAAQRDGNSKFVECQTRRSAARRRPICVRKTRTQGRYAEAEPLYERSLASREKAMGQVHPDVAQCLNNLAGRRGTGRRPVRSDAGPARSCPAAGRRRAPGSCGRGS
ncbi:MAG: tetratricopeptide repeat protein, partial [Hyphomicrobium sp.]